MADRWTEADLKRQYRYAKRMGWIPYFRASAASIDEPPELLLAIASRESNVKNIKGDLRNGRYNGFSLMQLDIGSHAAWIASGAWQDVRQAIQKGAEAYAEKRQQILDGRGKKLRAKVGWFTGARFTTSQLRHIALAAYNSGLNAYYSFSVDGPTDRHGYRDPDKRTTGKDYGRQVLARMEVFRELLEADEGTERAHVAVSARAGQASDSAEAEAAPLPAADPAPPSEPPPPVVVEQAAAVNVETSTTAVAVKGGAPGDETVQVVEDGSWFSQARTLSAKAYASLMTAGAITWERVSSTMGWAQENPLLVGGVLAAIVIAGLTLMILRQVRESRRERQLFELELERLRIAANPQQINAR